MSDMSFSETQQLGGCELRVLMNVNYIWSELRVLVVWHNSRVRGPHHHLSGHLQWGHISFCSLSSNGGQLQGNTVHSVPYQHMVVIFIYGSSSILFQLCYKEFSSIINIFITAAIVYCSNCATKSSLQLLMMMW